MPGYSPRQKAVRCESQNGSVRSTGLLPLLLSGDEGSAFTICDTWRRPYGWVLELTRRARALAAHVLAAPIARAIALTALTALGLSGDPVHEPVHAEPLRPRPSCCCA